MNDTPHDNRVTVEMIEAGRNAWDSNMGGDPGHVLRAIFTAMDASRPTAAASGDELVRRLRERLPVCPFDPKAPENDLKPSDRCPVCFDFGDERIKNLCRGADTRVMEQAADRIVELEEALRPFARLAVADDRMSGISPETLRPAVAVARAALTEQKEKRG